MTLRVALAVAFLTALCGCKRSEQDKASGKAPLRLGYFPNVTHGQALVGDREKVFSQALGDVPLTTKKFNAGPTAMEALVAGSIDLSYVGPGPAVTAYLKAGKQLRIISGSASGGAVFVVRTAQTPDDLRGKKIASPQLGNTQDIALRYWLMGKGYRIAGPKPDVEIMPLSNPDILAFYTQKQLEGAWVPEPWGARLLIEAGHILVNERDLWPDGKFPTTVLVTTQKALAERRDVLLRILRAHVELTERWRRNPLAFATQVNAAFGEFTGKPLPDDVLKNAFSRLEPTLDPLPNQLAEAARHAATLGFIPTADIAGIIETQLLNEALRP